MNTIYVLIPEGGAEGKLVQTATHDKVLFKKLNEKGFGVFFSVNLFNNFRRREEELAKLRYLYIDIDFRKEGDTKDITADKKAFIKTLSEFYPPTKIVETKNGMHPLWWVLEQDVQLYKDVLLQLIDWSKEYGSCGDSVKDVARILRLPNYYHNKGEPFMCKLLLDTNRRISMEDMSEKLAAMGYKKPIKKKYTPKQVDGNFAGDDVDIKTVFIDVCEAIGVRAEFDEYGRVILNGRLTGIFQGKHDNCQYIVGEASHERTPSGAIYEGNKITLVAKVLGISYQGAYKYLKEMYGKK